VERDCGPRSSYGWQLILTPLSEFGAVRLLSDKLLALMYVKQEVQKQQNQ
jgi:hypothetical protein